MFWEMGQRPILWMEGPAEGIALLSATLEKLEQAAAKQMAGESLIPKVAVPMLMRETGIQAFYIALSICGSSDDHGRRTTNYVAQHRRPTAEFFQQVPDFSETQPQPLILPDRQNNALLIRNRSTATTGGRTACVVGSAEPFDSYRSAYFETTEKISWELGLLARHWRFC